MQGYFKAVKVTLKILKAQTALPRQHANPFSMRLSPNSSRMSTVHTGEQASGTDSGKDDPQKHQDLRWAFPMLNCCSDFMCLLTAWANFISSIPLSSSIFSASFFFFLVISYHPGEVQATDSSSALWVVKFTRRGPLKWYLSKYICSSF